ITAKINNEIIPQLRAGVPKNTISHFKKNVLKLEPVHELQERNETRPVLQKIAHASIEDVSTEMSSSLDLKPRQVMHDMIVRQGIDPSTIVDLTHRSVSARNAYGGMLRKSKTPERSFDPSVRLLHKHVFAHTTLPDRSTTSRFDNQTMVAVSG